MKTAISIPDDLFDRAELLADRLGVSRSELYGRALKRFVQMHDTDEAIDALNAVFDDVQANPDADAEAEAAFRTQANRRVAERNPW